MSGAVHDPTAHEPLTEREWDPAAALSGIASIVADAEASLANAAWPFHPLDFEPDDPEELLTATGLYLGAPDGDVGAALFARSCLDADHRFPIMDVW